MNMKLNKKQKIADILMIMSASYLGVLIAELILSLCKGS